jgi:signal transduction histidine kinase
VIHLTEALLVLLKLFRLVPRHLLAGLLCCPFLFRPALAQPWTTEEITSAYVFNFAKNIKWPDEDRNPEFRFLIISDDAALNREMLNLSASQKLRGKPIRIIVSESIVIPKDVQLIFISHGFKDLTEPVFRRIEGRKTLLITDGIEDKRIVMINLIGTKAKTIKFEINKANILNQGLEVLPDMVLLGGTEIDVAKLYKEAQDTLRIKERERATLQRHLDSLNAQIVITNKGIEKQNLLIANQNQAIAEQQNQLGKQRDTLSRQAAALSRQAASLSGSQLQLRQAEGMLQQQQGILNRQRREVEDGKKVLADQEAKIDAQNASIREKIQVLGEQGMTIAAQKNIQRVLIVTIVLVLGSTYAIYRSYKSKQLSNQRLQAQEKQIRQLNHELVVRAAALEIANKELEAFSYSVSHDLRAPLRSIDGFSQIILEDYEDRLDERGKDYFRRVRSAAQRMAHLIDDMLNLSRVTRNEMEMREIDLSGLARDIADKLAKLQPGRHADFIIQPGIKVRGDEHLLRIALENLMDNAWKYTSKHPTARIEFGARMSGQDRIFFVRDDGAGFDMKYSRKLFGAFQRLHTDDEFPGMGIGLATVQRIIRRHGGKIWAEGESEKGATFHFMIPPAKGESV